MSEYELSPEAREEVWEIWSYIARDDEESADKWILSLLEAFDLLARNPHIGHTRKDLTDSELLFWPVERYLVLYRLAGENIEIAAVTQGSRDIPPICASVHESQRSTLRSYKLACHGNNWLWYGDRHSFSRGWGD